MGQGSPEQGQLTRPEAGDFGGVACCQMERPRVPVFGRMGQGIGDGQMCPGGWTTVRLEGLEARPGGVTGQGQLGQHLVSPTGDLGPGLPLGIPLSV